MTTDTHDSLILRAIMDAAVDAMIVSDKDGIIIRANAAACRLFGFDLDELVGHNVNILMPPTMAERHDGFMAAHVQTGERRIIGIGREADGQRKDRSTFPLHLSVGRTDLSGVPYFVAILHDLTQRNATQGALSRSQRLEAIGQMTGGIVHDFNNFLTVVIGNLELLETRLTDKRQHDLALDALNAAELGANLTSRLMVFARQSNLKPLVVDLREVCRDTLAILERTIGALFNIRVDFGEDISPVSVDPVQLQSALMNLALNAKDAMPEGGELLITVSNILIDDSYMAQETDIVPGHYVRLSVSDNGSGMSQEMQDRAFEPFFSTKSDSGGSGLGLPMVYGFVRQSGGHITLYSELGHGTSFGLYFPALEAPDHATRTLPPNGLPRRLPRGQGQVVLVVEDNAKVRRLSVERLGDLGFKAVEAESGDAAYAMLQSGLKAAIVFSDLVMPGTLNGYDLAAKVRAEFPDTKVLLTSGYASDVVTSAMAEGQNFDVLHKPYRLSELALRLQALLLGAPG
ncbi:PAS domain S-box protein [Aestuariivita sp.]|jgi:PAS domain S-box-containing protein|uniref:PAS domain S-box protein n=1 Tax=Aestuariivita sp. TaxID=1872407 RepID=UPI00217402F5|nr:PAS domain S-box protein [Aestuariivita sp.]MCE8005951.1 PAS domain S-box protein [Aestuariivita sp.]